jgi:hypothetical protein
LLLVIILFRLPTPDFIFPFSLPSLVRPPEICVQTPRQAAPPPHPACHDLSVANLLEGVWLAKFMNKHIKILVEVVET